MTIALAIVLAIILIWFGTFALRQAGILPSLGIDNPLEPAPSEIKFAVCQTRRDKGLPNDLFGSPTDEIAKARIWMEILEKGAEAKLATMNPRHLWLLGEPLKHFPPFTAILDVNTAKGMVVIPYLIRKEHSPAFAPLSQVQGTGPANQYLFEVPETNDEDRVLVFLSMDDGVYEAIKAEPKFTMATRITSGEHK